MARCLAKLIKHFPLSTVVIFCVMSRLLLALFFILLSVHWVDGTVRGSNLLELEDYIPCFTRYAPRLWNIVMSSLPAVTRANVDEISLVFRWVRQAMLTRRQAPCRAAERGLLTLALRTMTLEEIQAVRERCELQWPRPEDLITDSGPFHICLNAAHNHATTAIPRTHTEERIESANFVALAEADSPEATTTFTGQYSDYKIQTVIQAIRWNIQHSMQWNMSSTNNIVY